MTLWEDIYELVLMCVISGCLVAPRKVLSSGNDEEKGSISRGGEPPYADQEGRGRSPFRPRVQTWCWVTTSGEWRVVEPQAGVCMLSGAPGFPSVSLPPTPT